MSSETSTSRVRLKPDATSLADTAEGDHGLAPWQFFVLAALGCATAATFIARGQGVAAVVLITSLMASAALVGIAALRAVRPLVSAPDDRTAMVGQRTRAALEREKLLTLKTIKELEFDRAMGKLSDADWQDMSTRLRSRVARLMRQLDASSGFRDQIERDLAKRIGETKTKVRLKADTTTEAATNRDDVSPERRCAACDAANDDDARFCKACGQPLVTR